MTMIQTTIHAITFNNVSGLLIKNNRFIPNPNGGTTYSWIASFDKNYQEHISIIDNHFYDSMDHSLYCESMHYSVVAGNTVKNSAGLALKITGDYNVIANNTISHSQGGISARDGSNNIIANNVIDDCQNVGIIIYPLDTSGVNFTNNIIEGNIIHNIRDTNYKFECIRVWGPGVSGTKIINNTIIYSGQATPTDLGAIVVRSTAAISYDITISGNTIEHCDGNGIYLYNIRDSLISDNIIDIPTGRAAFSTPGSSNNSFQDNLISTY